MYFMVLFLLGLGLGFAYFFLRGLKEFLLDLKHGRDRDEWD